MEQTKIVGRMMVEAEGFEPPILCSQSDIYIVSAAYPEVPLFTLRCVFAGVPGIHIAGTDSLIYPQFLSSVPTKVPTVVWGLARGAHGFSPGEKGYNRPHEQARAHSPRGRAQDTA